MKYIFLKELKKRLHGKKSINIYDSNCCSTVSIVTWEQEVILTVLCSGVPPGGVAEERRFSLWAILLLGCFKALFSSLMLAWCFCRTSSGLSKNCCLHTRETNKNNVTILDLNLFGSGNNHLYISLFFFKILTLTLF